MSDSTPKSSPKSSPDPQPASNPPGSGAEVVEQPMKVQPYKYMVRLPPSMREQLRESARHYRRSMNSDIVARLHQSFSGIPDASAVRDLEPAMHEQFENLFRRELSADEEQLVRTYRRMSSRKREALRNLLV